MNNDFHEYSAAFQDHQNDLAHYGVKGMKWKHHKRSIREWWNGGDSEDNRQGAAHVVNIKKKDILKNVYGKKYDPDKDPRRVKLRNGSYSSISPKDTIDVSKATRTYNSEHLKKDSYDQALSNYNKAEVKAKIAKNKSVVGKAKRNLGALKDTVKSISLDDYKNFYGEIFKKKKRKSNRR